ncbi:MAG: hypothetical protein ACM3O7_05580 [Acidobacteriota bacterium]
MGHRTSRPAALSGLVAIMLATAGLAHAGIRVRDYVLDIRFIPDRAELSGRATVSFVPPAPTPAEVTFVLHGELEVSTVTIGAQPARFSQSKVLLPGEYSLVGTRVVVQTRGADLAAGMTVAYRGTFNPSNARSSDQAIRIDRDGVVLAGSESSPWFPVFEEEGGRRGPVTFKTVWLSLPESFRALFPGRLASEKLSGGQRISEWVAEDVDPADVGCIARQFSATDAGNLHVWHLADAHSVAAARSIASFAARLAEQCAITYRHDVANDALYVVEVPGSVTFSGRNVVAIPDGAWRVFDINPLARTTLARGLVRPYIAIRLPEGDRLTALAAVGFPAYLHLPILYLLSGGSSYDQAMAWIEGRYLRERAELSRTTGSAARPEKPLATISASEIAAPRENSLVADRASLFLNWLRSHIGPKAFFTFTADLFNRPQLDFDTFTRLVESYLPGSGADLHTWLETTEYPDRFRVAGAASSAPGRPR